MATNSSYLAYVDESGDEGFTYGTANHSSEWFVLSAAVVRTPRDRELLGVCRNIRLTLGKPAGYTLHFCNLKHEQRVFVANTLASVSMRFVSVACHKPSLTETEYLHKKHALYFYLSRFLFERVSWLCRDSRRLSEGDGSVEIVFSNRSSMPYGEIQDYLTLLRNRVEVQIDWTAIKPNQITALPHHLRAGLQVVDAIASSTFAAMEPNRFGFVEDRYARELLRIGYRHNRKLLGYGIKIWPVERLAVLQNDPRYSWLFQ
jgi:hypothetical protein